MDFNVDRIPGQLRIDPDAGGNGYQRRRERQEPKRVGGADSVSISDEAKRRSSEGEGREAE